MDTSLLVTLIVAAVAIIPAVWALVNQANKDKEQNTVQMSMVNTLYDHMKDATVQISNLRDDVNYTKYSINDRITANIKYGDVADKVWEKMYEKPVIIRCKHCRSSNVITNLNCLQCGAPMED